MIKALRIDERMIHGQVAVAWCTTLSVDSIIVANDEVAKDEITIMSLKMVAPQHIRVVVKSLDDTVKLFQDPRIHTKTILLLVTNPKDALYLIDNISDVPYVNVGNFGMIENSDNRKSLGTSLAVNDEEVEIFREIVQKRPESNYQMTPTLTPKLLSDLIK
jgi:Phosphotransferase system, mannose/fructose/N-acetylgalactosamine-specific component IIB